VPTLLNVCRGLSWLAPDTASLMAARLLRASHSVHRGHRHVRNHVVSLLNETYRVVCALRTHARKA
jgi:hypothetical protein